MRVSKLCWPLAMMLAGILVCGGLAADHAAQLARIKAVGKEGQGNADAARAWKELVAAGPAALFDILRAMDEDNVISANWLRPAVAAISDKAGSKGLSLQVLEAFVKDRQNPALGRRVAYELLTARDQTAPARLLPGMLKDPSADLRRDAVAAAIKDAETLLKKDDKDAARTAFRKAFAGACDDDQVADIAAKLKDLGDKVDLARHYGFIQAWHLVAPFDNANAAHFQTVYAPEKGVDLKESYRGRDGAVRWQGYTTTDPHGIVDFNRLYGDWKGATAYAFAVIESPRGAQGTASGGLDECVQDLGQRQGGADPRGIPPRHAHRSIHRVCQAEGGAQRGLAEDLPEREEAVVGEGLEVPGTAVRRCRSGGAVHPGVGEIGADAARTAQGKEMNQGTNFHSTRITIMKKQLVFALAMAAGLCWQVGGADRVMAADWPQFRGPGSSSVSEEKDPPIKWSATEGLRWKAALPGRGLSNPVIAGGKVFVTASSGFRERRLHVLCFDAESGKKLWERQFNSTGLTTCHAKTCMAAPTPVTDGKSVYALFATADLAALDADGNLLWYRSLARDYPAIANQVGMAASPVLAGDTLLIPMETDGESFVAGLDRKTGENKWKLERQRKVRWVSPVVMTTAGRPAALFLSPTDMTAYNPDTGKVRWTCAIDGTSDIPSPVAGDGMVFVPGQQFVALRPGEDNVTPEILWKSGKYRTGYTSPVYYRKKLYLLTNTNVTAVNALTGEEGWKQRVDGPFAATPVVADGKLYAVNEKGTTFVIALGDQPKILATNKLDDTILATPAIAGGAIYLRSDGFLYCIDGKKPRE